jgi:subtilase family serine protease
MTGLTRRLGIPGSVALLLALAVGGLANADSAASVAASVRVASAVISVRLALSSGTARVGDTVKATATVTNSGTGRATDVAVSLRIDSTGLRIRGADTTTIATLQPGRSRSVAWTVCAVQAGTFVLLVRATVDGVSVESPGVLLTVSGQRRKGC